MLSPSATLTSSPLFLPSRNAASGTVIVTSSGRTPPRLTIFLLITRSSPAFSVTPPALEITSMSVALLRSSISPGLWNSPMALTWTNAARGT